VDLISGLLNKNPNKRMNMDDIFGHKWMKIYYVNKGINIKEVL
jgi:hypothetical protein